MIDNIIDKLGKENLENIAIDTHIPAKNAVYVLLSEDMHCSVINWEQFSRNETYKKLDYYSNVINTNKSIDKKKKISSNNKYTFFCRHTDKLTDVIIDGYFEAVDPEKENEEFCRWIKERYGTFEKGKQEYLKVFYLKNIEECFDCGRSYMKEYCLTKSKKIAKEDTGNSVFYSANYKKPYSARTSLKQDNWLIDSGTAYNYLCVYNILKALLKQGKNIVYASNGVINGYNVSNGDPADVINGVMIATDFNSRGELNILDYDTIASYKSNLNDGVMFLRDKEIKKKHELERIISRTFFGNKLTTSYFSKSSVNDAVIRSTVEKYKNAYFEYFWKGKDNNIIEVFDKSTLDVIKGSVFNDHMGLARKQFELRWEVLNYLDGRKIKWEVEEAHEQLRKHINSQKEQEWSFTNDNEYNIALGVLIRYMGTLLGSRFNAGYYLKPILKAKSTNVIKKKIIEMYKRCNNKINHINGGRVQQLIDHIMEEKTHINVELMLAGYVKDSLIYEKK